MIEGSVAKRAGTPDEVGAVGALLMGPDGGPSGYNGNTEVTGLPECAPNQLLKTWVRTQTVEGWLDV